MIIRVKRHWALFSFPLSGPGCWFWCSFLVFCFPVFLVVLLTYFPKFLRAPTALLGINTDSNFKVSKNASRKRCISWIASLQCPNSTKKKAAPRSRYIYSLGCLRLDNKLVLFFLFPPPKEPFWCTYNLTRLRILSASASSSCHKPYHICSPFSDPTMTLLEFQSLCQPSFSDVAPSILIALFIFLGTSTVTSSI